MGIRLTACATSRRTCDSRPARSCIGRDPSDWKPMQTIGAGVREIRLRDGSGAFRVIYVATFADAVHVLHAFQKKSQKTAQRDLDLAAARLRDLKRELRS